MKSPLLRTPPTALGSPSSRLTWIAGGCLAVACGPTDTVRAHPGHSWLESSPSHLLMEPEHAAALLAAGIGLALLARVVRLSWLRRITATAGVLAFGASLVAIGLRGSF